MTPLGIGVLSHYRAKTVFACRRLLAYRPQVLVLTERNPIVRLQPRRTETMVASIDMVGTERSDVLSLSFSATRALDYGARTAFFFSSSPSFADSKTSKLDRIITTAAPTAYGRMLGPHRVTGTTLSSVTVQLSM